jgi:iron complex transport system ATP-binding protein
LARALVQQAPVLFLDEALGKMDLDYQIDLAARLKSLILPDSKSPFAVRAVVLVTHDFALASRYGDEAWVLCSGRVLAQGPFNQVLSPEVLGRLYPRAWQSDFFKNKE